jgi:hypothetical protein
LRGYKKQVKYSDSSRGQGNSGNSSNGLNGASSAGAPDIARLEEETRALLTEMTQKFREELPEELREHFDPHAPREELATEDTQRLADGYLPLAWYDRAAEVTGPPSWQVAAMEAPGPGMSWPGGRPEADKMRELYDLQVDWLADIAWKHKHD